MLDIIVIPLLICLILSFRIRKGPGETDIFSRTQTACINGLFVFMIFVRHFSEYIQAGRFDWVLGVEQRYLDQLIVVSFMLFSGYSFYLQQKKNSGYLRKLPKKILLLWLMFIVTVLAFLLMQLLRGNTYDLSTVLLSLIGVKKVGNSNWYVFAIMFFWLFSYISFSQKRIKPNILMAVFTAVYMLVFSQFLIKDPVMYNTVIAYLYGIILAKHEPAILGFLRKKAVFWAAATVSLAGIVTGLCFREHFIPFETAVTAFSLFLILFCMKIKMESPVFLWLNMYSFEIYLIQRIPMIALEGKISPNILYFLVSLLLTLGLALVWKKIYELLAKRILAG